jgi:hypothetical protein
LKKVSWWGWHKNKKRIKWWWWYTNEEKNLMSKVTTKNNLMKEVAQFEKRNLMMGEAQKWKRKSQWRRHRNVKENLMVGKAQKWKRISHSGEGQKLEKKIS